MLGGIARRATGRLLVLRGDIDWKMVCAGAFGVPRHKGHAR